MSRSSLHCVAAVSHLSLMTTKGTNPTFFPKVFFSLLVGNLFSFLELSVRYIIMLVSFNYVFHYGFTSYEFYLDSIRIHRNY